MMKKALSALMLFGAATAAQADWLVTQNFDNVAALPGWVQTNNSSPAGTNSWFQGDQQIFTAYQGASNSYIAANFNSAAAGGTIDNWLITPEFNSETGATVSLWLRGDANPDFFDTVSFGVSNGSSNIVDFVLSPSFVVNQGGWLHYTFNIAAGGLGSTARFAINYQGLADVSNYIGIDSLEIAAIPEPTSVLLLGAGLAGLIATRRRQRAAA
jgi:hypothetical protein